METNASFDLFIPKTRKRLGSSLLVCLLCTKGGEISLFERTEIGVPNKLAYHALSFCGLWGLRLRGLRMRDLRFRDLRLRGLRLRDLRLRGLRLRGLRFRSLRFAFLRFAGLVVCGLCDLRVCGLWICRFAYFFLILRSLEFRQLW